MQMTLCARCSELMRDRHIVRVIYRDVTKKFDCDNCKRHTYGATFDITPKRREKP